MATRFPTACIATLGAVLCGTATAGEREALEQLHSGSSFADAVGAELGDAARAELSGNGCAPGTFDGQWLDSATLRVRYRDFAVRAGAESADNRAIDRKDCAQRLFVNVAAGYSAAIEAVEVRGHAKLSDRSAEALIDASYAAEAARWPVELVRRQATGPYDSSFATPGRPPREQLQWTPCGAAGSRYFDLANALAVHADSFAGAALDGDPFDGSISFDYHFVVRRCAPEPQPQPWVGVCRVVQETLWGQDLREFWGNVRGATQTEAVTRARQSGVAQCEAVRNGDALTKCSVDSGQCYATQQ